MLVLVNVSNQGKPLGLATLKDIRALGLDGVRTDILPEGAEEQLREFRDNAHLQLLALIHGGNMPGDEQTLFDEAKHAARIARENLSMHTLGNRPIFELGNEPNIKDSTVWRDPDRFGKAVSRASQVIWDVMGPETLVVSGAIHNPGPKAQQYLKKAARHFPRDAGKFAVGFHNYAPGMGDPDRPQSGFKTVEAQIGRLMDLGFPLFDTESGGHTAKPQNHTADQIAAWLKRRLDLSKQWGLLGTVVFQLQDGPNPEHFESRFGLLSHGDRAWKPSAHALKEWIDADRKRVADRAPNADPAPVVPEPGTVELAPPRKRPKGGRQ